VSSTDTMRAALLSGPGQIEVVSIPRPVPAAGEVLIEVEANAICGSDLKAYRGHYARGSFPTVLGHEFVGRVVEGDEAVTGVPSGSRVCVEPNLRCGSCEYCQAGLTNMCPEYHLMGESLDYQGACAEYVAVPAASVHPLPEAVSMLEGALVQPLAISYEGVVERGRVAAAEKVLVVGAGPIGLGALVLAGNVGAQVMVSDPVGYRLEKALELGAERVVSSGSESLAEAVADFTDGRGVDLAVEAVGGAQSASLVDAQRATARRGRIVVLGGFSSRETPFSVSDFKNKEQTLLGSLGHPGTFAPVIDLIAKRQLRPEAMVSHAVALDELPTMLRLLDEKSDGVLKVVILPRSADGKS
jgi:L-gulonate 5-dehydrogenase